MNDQKPKQNRNVKTTRARTQISWHHIPAEMLRTYVDGITNAGCAVVLGRTINGSALSVCVLAGNDKLRDYISSIDDFEPMMDGILADLDIDPVTGF